MSKFAQWTIENLYGYSKEHKYKPVSSEVTKAIAKLNKMANGIIAERSTDDSMLFSEIVKIQQRFVEKNATCFDFIGLLNEEIQNFHKMKNQPMPERERKKSTETHSLLDQLLVEIANNPQKFANAVGTVVHGHRNDYSSTTPQIFEIEEEQPSRHFRGAITAPPERKLLPPPSSSSSNRPNPPQQRYNNFQNNQN